MFFATRQTLFRRLEELGIETRTVEHSAVFTVSESRAIDRNIEGGHTKNLFLKDAKGALFLIIAHTDTTVDLKGLAKRIDSARLSFGKTDLLQSVLGVSPGSVTAFALINDSDLRVRVIIDEVLTRFRTVNCHPLENTATTNIACDDLLRFIRSTGHEPMTMELSKDHVACEAGT